MNSQNISIFVKKHKIACGFFVIVLALGAYFGFKALGSDSGETKYVLAAVEKGALITSVSGTGQIEVSDQVDLQAKAAGDIIFVRALKDQSVKAGQLLLQIDPSSAQRAVNEAEIALESAQINLDDLLASPTEQEITQAENALAQAQRDLEKAEKAYNKIEGNTEQTLNEAYENGYNDVSNSFFKLSDYMKDLKDIMGTDQSEQEYVTAYKAILTQNSLFVQQLVEDYSTAKNIYNQNIGFFRQVSKTNRGDVYKLVKAAKDTAQAISNALESSRHLFDILETRNYKDFSVSAVVDKMQPKVEADLSAVFSVITSLQNTINTIDQTVEDTPGNIKDAKLAFQAAQEKVVDKQEALDDLKAGADEIDIRAQRNIVAQKEAALSSARENLGACSVLALFDGVMAKVEVEKGDSVSAGNQLATLITNQQVAVISLNEVDASEIETGQKATLAFDAVDGLEITGRVVDVETLGTVSQGVVSYKIKIVLDAQDNRIKPSMTVSAIIITRAKQNVLLVPNSAVKSSGGQYFVETLEDIQATEIPVTASVTGIASKTSPVQKPIEVGLANDSYTEIVSGLDEGALIIARTTTAASQGSAATAANGAASSANRALRTGGGVMMFGR